MADYEVRAVLSAADSGWTSAFRVAGEAVENLDSVVGETSNSILSKLSDTSSKGLSFLNKFTGVATTALGAATGAFMADAIETGMDFDQIMSKVESKVIEVDKKTGKAVRPSKKLMDEMAEKAMEVGAKTIFSGTQSAQALLELTSAGFTAQEAMDSLDGTADLAAASDISLGDAAKYAARAVNTFGLTAKDVTKIADVYAYASATSGANTDTLAKAMEYIGPVANSLGYDIADVSSIIAVLSNQGITAGKAGRSLRAMLDSLSNPSKDAEDALSDLGISLFDSKGNAKELYEVVGELEDGLKGLTTGEREKAIGRIFGRTGSTAINALLSVGSDKLKEYNDELQDTGGIAELIGKILKDNLAGDLEALGGTFELLKNNISNIVEGPLRTFVQQMTDSVENVANWFKGLNTVDDVITKLNNQFGEIITKIKAFIGILATMNAVVHLADRFKNFDKVIYKGVDKIKIAWNTLRSINIKQGFKGIFKGFKSTLDFTFDLIIKSIKAFINVSVLAVITSGILAIIGMVYEQYQTQIDKFFTFIKEDFPGRLDNFVNSIVPKIEGYISSGGDFVLELADAITVALPALLEAGARIINALLQGLTDNIHKIVFAGLKIIVSLVEGIVEKLPQLMLTAGDFVLELADAIMVALPALLEAGARMVNALMQGLTDNIDKIVIAGFKIIVSLVEGIAENLPQLMLTALELIVALGASLISNAPKLIIAGIDIVIAIGRGIIDNLDQIALAAWEIIKTLAKTIQEGVVFLVKIVIAGIEWIITKIKENVSGFVNVVKHFGDIIKTFFTDGVKAGIDKAGKYWGEGLADTKEKASEHVSYMDKLREEYSLETEEKSKSHYQRELEAQENYYDTFRTSADGYNAENLNAQVTSNEQYLANEQSHISDIKVATENGLSSINEITETGLETRNEKHSISNHALKSMTEEELQQLSKLTGISMDEINKTISEGSSLAVDNFGENMNQMVNSTSTGTDSISTDFTKIPKSLSDNTNMIKSQEVVYKRALTNMSKTTTTSLDSITKKFKSAFKGIDSIVSSSSGRYTKDINKLFANINKAVTNGTNKMNTKMRSSFEKMGNISLTNSRKITLDITRMFTEMNTATNRTMRLMESRLKLGLTHMKSNSNEFIIWQNKSWLNLFMKILKYTNTSFNRIRSTWSSNSNKIISLSISLRNQVQNIFRSMSGSMYNSGYRAGQGFYNGLSRWSRSISSRARNMANSVVYETRRALDIHSPSGVMTDLGMDTGEGYAIGLLKLVTRVRDAAQSLTGAATDYDMFTGDGLTLTSTTGADFSAPSSMVDRQPLQLLIEMNGRTWQGFVDDVMETGQHRLELKEKY